MKRTLAFAGAAIAAACLAVLSAVPNALAAEASAPAAHVVVIPWGDWLASLLAASGGVVAVGISWALRGAPAALRAFLTNDAIGKAANYIIATQIGLVKGRTVEIPVANDLIVMIADRIVESEPLVARWAGERLEPLIVAELSRLGMIPAEASAADLGLAAM